MSEQDLSEDIYQGLFYNYSIDVPKRKTVSFDFPVLEKGDYFIRLVHWKDAFTDNGTFIDYWYGSSEKTVLTDIEIDDLEGMSTSYLSPNARLIHMPTDTTWIQGLNLGTTAIIANSGIKKSKGISNLVTVNRSLSFSYSLKNSGNANIYDLSGRKLATMALTEKSGAVKWTPSISLGVYLLEITDGTVQLNHKFLLK